jgi:hypothetical protein
LPDFGSFNLNEGTFDASTHPYLIGKNPTLPALRFVGLGFGERSNWLSEVSDTDLSEDVAGDDIQASIRIAVDHLSREPALPPVDHLQIGFKLNNAPHWIEPPQPNTAKKASGFRILLWQPGLRNSVGWKSQSVYSQTGAELEGSAFELVGSFAIGGKSGPKPTIDLLQGLKKSGLRSDESAYVILADSRSLYRKFSPYKDISQPAFRFLIELKPRHMSFHGRYFPHVEYFPRATVSWDTNREIGLNSYQEITPMGEHIVFPKQYQGIWGRAGLAGRITYRDQTVHGATALSNGKSLLFSTQLKGIVGSGETDPCAEQGNTSCVAPLPNGHFGLQQIEVTTDSEKAVPFEIVAFRISDLGLTEAEVVGKGEVSALQPHLIDASHLEPLEPRSWRSAQSLPYIVSLVARVDGRSLGFLELRQGWRMVRRDVPRVGIFPY